MLMFDRLSEGKNPTRTIFEELQTEFENFTVPIP